MLPSSLNFYVNDLCDIPGYSRHASQCRTFCVLVFVVTFLGMKLYWVSQILLYVRRIL